MSPETDFERRLVRSARDLPTYPPPPTLRERMLDRLPGLANEHLPDKWRGRVLGAAILVILAILVWLFTPLTLSLLSDPGAEAMAAMQRANTWHMSGWKVQRLNRLDWEVWGRRKPFFFYEKLGDHITYDDGQQRIEVIPQDVTKGTDSLVIKSSSESRGAAGMGYTFSMRGWRKGNRPKTITAHDYIFETFDYGGDFGDAGIYQESPDLVTHNLLYVNRKTLRPDRIREVQTNRALSLAGTVIEDVQIELNKDLPPNITAPTWPAGYVVLDATVPHDTSAVPKDNVAYKDGLSAQLTPLAMDKNGDVLFRARGWFGNTRLCSASFAQLGVGAPVSESALPRGPWPYHDNLGRDYVMTWWPHPPFPSPAGDELILFSPAAPIKAGQILPKTMTISLSISAYILRPWLSRDLSWKVSLASAPIKPNFDVFWAQRDPNWRKDWLGHMKGTLPAAADDARSWYWLWQAGPFVKKSNALLQSVKWEQRAVQDSVPISAEANYYRSVLASRYAQVGDYQKERAVLKEIVSVGKRRHDPWDYNVTMAEKALQDGNGSKPH
jgi:hypothetical protein